MMTKHAQRQNLFRRRIYFVFLGIVFMLGASPTVGAEPLAGEYVPWKEHRDRLAKDPSLVLYFPLNDKIGLSIQNRAEAAFRQVELPGVRFRRASLLDGTLQNVEWVAKSRIPGKQCLSFNGHSAVLFKQDLPDEFQLLPRKTICVWIWVAGKGPMGLGRIMNRENYNAVNVNGWAFFISNPDAEGKFGLQYTHGFSGPPPLMGGWYSSGPKLTLNQWFHIAVAYDSSSVTNKPVFYINGKRQEAGVNQGPAGEALDETVNGLAIGTMAASCGGAWNFQGYMDEIMVFNRLLTDDEIGKLTKMEYPAIPTPGP